MHDISTKAGRDAYIAECEQAVANMRAEELRREGEVRKAMLDVQVQCWLQVWALNLEQQRNFLRELRLRADDDTYSFIA